METYNLWSYLYNMKLLDLIKEDEFDKKGASEEDYKRVKTIYNVLRNGQLKLNTSENDIPALQLSTLFDNTDYIVDYELPKNYKIFFGKDRNSKYDIIHIKFHDIKISVEKTKNQDFVSLFNSNFKDDVIVKKGIFYWLNKKLNKYNIKLNINF